MQADKEEKRNAELTTQEAKSRAGLVAIVGEEGGVQDGIRLLVGGRDIS